MGHNPTHARQIVNLLFHPITYYDSFSNRLPYIKNPGFPGAGDQDAYSKINPPLCVFEKSARWWVSDARKAVNIYKKFLTKLFVNYNFRSQCHHLEADVVHSSSFAFLDPVHTALELWIHRRKGQSLRTVNKNTPPAFYFRSEFTQGAGRSDFAWFTDENATKPFAILEYKRAGRVVPTNFRELFSPKMSAPEFESWKATQKGLSVFPPDQDESTLMRQLTLYAMENDTDYIALFEWTTLILVKFNRGKSGVIETCDMTIFGLGTQQKPADRERYREEMQLGLLGFLMRAWSAKRKNTAVDDKLEATAMTDDMGIIDDED